MNVITTAGLDVSPPTDTKRERLKVIRQALFKQDATDDEREDALDALTELSKE